MNDTNFLRRIWEQMQAQIETPNQPSPPKPTPTPAPIEMFGEYSYLSDNGIVVKRETVTLPADVSSDKLVDTFNTLLEKLAQTLKPLLHTKTKNAGVAIYLVQNGCSEAVDVICFQKEWTIAYSDAFETLKLLTNRIGTGEATRV